MMKRREFVAGLAGGVVWPVVARAEQPAMPVIGYLNSASRDAFAPYVAAFLRGLKEGGFVEGQNVMIEYRSTEDKPERLPALAADLVGLPVSVLVANSSGPALAAKQATSTLPIVFL